MAQPLQHQTNTVVEQEVLALKKEAVAAHNAILFAESDDMAYVNGKGSVIDEHRTALFRVSTRLAALGHALTPKFFVSDEAASLR